MKIVAVSSFNQENVAEILVAEHVNENYIDELILHLNVRYSGKSSRYFFCKQADEYRLWRGMEDLV